MKRNTLLLVAAMLVASCSIYHPQSVDIPLVQHRGEFRGDVNVSASAWIILPDVVSVGVTGTYGVTDWLSAQVHANYGVDNWYIQAAPGLYKPIGEKFVVEGYVGYGLGGVDHQQKVPDSETEYRDQYKGTFQLPFVQVNAGWRRLGPVDLAFGLKTGAFLPEVEEYHYTSSAPTTVDHTDRYTTSNFLLEPQLQLRVGGKKVNFTIRYGCVFMSDLDWDKVDLNYDRFTLSAGIGFNL